MIIVVNGVLIFDWSAGGLHANFAIVGKNPEARNNPMSLPSSA